VNGLLYYHAILQKTNPVLPCLLKFTFELPHYDWGVKIGKLNVSTLSYR
jgi:hypothetical protein